MMVDMHTVDKGVGAVDERLNLNVSITVLILVIVAVLGTMKMYDIWRRRRGYKIIGDEMASDRAIQTVVH